MLIHVFIVYVPMQSACSWPKGKPESKMVCVSELIPHWGWLEIDRNGGRLELPLLQELVLVLLVLLVVLVLPVVLVVLVALVALVLVLMMVLVELLAAGCRSGMVRRTVSFAAPYVTRNSGIVCDDL